jgi:antitoxin VapB
MALNIKNEAVVRLIRRLADERNVDQTEAVRLAVSHELESPNNHDEAKLRRMRLAARQIMALPVLDDRTPDEILGYGGDGLPA